MKHLFTFLVFFCLTIISLKSQTIGQTKAYVLKKYKDCEIVENKEKLLLLNCAELEMMFVFDENNLCSFLMCEITISHWNTMQVDLIWANAELLGKTTGPLPKKESWDTPIMVYQDNQNEYFFYNCDFNGDSKATVKTVSIRKRKP